jgi:hypothetical protein
MSTKLAKKAHAIDHPTMPPKKRCGCVCIIGIVLALAIAGGALAWYLLPDDTKEDISVSFGDATRAPTTAPAPTPAPTPSFNFQQCSAADANCCNGLTVGTCQLRADEMLYAYMHNAVATSENGFRVLPNHEFGLEKALRSGFRALELDVGRCGSGNDLVFFHSTCTLGSRPAAEVWEAIDTFLTEEPTEVVILFLQMPEVDEVTLTELDEAIQSVPGLPDRLYQHSIPGTPWPTLGELVAADERLILLYFNQPDCFAQVNGCPTGFNFWPDFGVETSFRFQNVGDVDDTPASCALRESGQNGARDFYRVNAFLQLPSRGSSTTLNSYDYATDRLNACPLVAGQAVNFYAVDYWSEGDVPQVVQEVNTARAQANVRR